MTRSLWSRVLLGTTVSTVLVLAAAGFTIHAVARLWLLNELETSMAGKARALASVVEQEGGEVEFDFDEEIQVEFSRRDRPEYLQVWQVGGGSLYRSRSLGERDLERVRGRLDAPEFRSATLPSGRSGCLTAITFVPRFKHTTGPPKKVTLTIARETRDMERALTQLALLLTAVCTAATFLLIGLHDWSVTRAIRPVRRLAAEIGDLEETTLSTRIEPGDTPGELLPVVDRLNGLLGRLDDAFEREKSFTANVAHELRTPLAGLLTTLELALSKQRDPAAYRDALSRCQIISSQMRTMIDNLLSLARADTGRMQVAMEAVPAGGLLQDCWAVFAPEADARGLQVEWRLDDACEIVADRELLRLIFRNLLGNAVAYADDGGIVRIEWLDGSERPGLRITNTGSKLSAEQARHVFERFWQGDSSRAATGVHCGLGLALSERLMTLLGGSITVESVPGGEFTVTLQFRSA